MYEEQNENFLQHWGVLGMRWGTWRGKRKTAKIEKKIDKTIKRFDNGYKVNPSKFTDQSRTVRKLAAKNNKKIAKLNKYIEKHRGTETRTLLIKHKSNKVKREKAIEFLAANELQKKRLSEIRDKLVDVKSDAYRY